MWPFAESKLKTSRVKNETGLSRKFRVGPFMVIFIPIAGCIDAVSIAVFGRRRKQVQGAYSLPGLWL